MGERAVEVGALTEIRDQIGDGKSAGLTQHATDRESAGRVRELRLAACEPPERRGQNLERHRLRVHDPLLSPSEII